MRVDNGLSNILAIATTCCLLSCAITQTITRYLSLFSSNTNKMKEDGLQVRDRDVLHPAGTPRPLPTACKSNFDFRGFRHEHVIHSGAG